MKNKQSSFSIKNRFKSFSYAFIGIKTMFVNEHNSWIHMAAAVLAIILGLFFKINNTERCFILFAIGLVFIAEIINTAIETLTDMVSPEYNKKAKEVKDLAAGAVLLASITALIIGLIVYAERLLTFFNR
jgi:diacylglycerol kinase (ATP)